MDREVSELTVNVDGTEKPQGLALLFEAGDERQLSVAFLPLPAPPPTPLVPARFVVRMPQALHRGCESSPHRFA